MRCSRCETELPDSATICSRCGTPTRASVTPAFTGFSYLPVGAPPWPTTVPQRLTQPTASIATTAALPAPPARRPLGKVLLTIAIVILIPLLGAAATFGALYAQGKVGNNATPASSANASTPQQVVATPTPLPANQLPTPTSFKQISDKDLNASFKYPSTWTADAIQKASDASSVEQHVYSQQVSIDFFFVHFEPSQSSQYNGANDVNQQNMEQLQLQGANIQLVSAQNPQPQIAGTTWTEMDGTFQDSKGDTVHVISISVKHNGAYYTILSLIPENYLAPATQKYIQPMLNSVKFLS